MPHPHGSDDWVTLLPEDAQALDALMASDEPRTAPADDARAQAVRRTLSLLDQLPDETPPTGLADRAIARVGVTRSRLRLVGAGEARMPSFGLTLPELLSLAAMIVFSISLALPLLARNRADAQRFACRSNLAQTATALIAYAGDHGDVMPREFIEPGVAWWQVGDRPRRNHAVRSNSAHLYLLARHGYVSPDALACPAYEHAPRGMTTAMYDWPRFEAVSYSYQNQYTPEAPRLSRLGDMIVLADKNPLFFVEPRVGLTHRDDLPATSPSTLHGSRGQNMLTAAGNVIWNASPVVRNDNIWLASGIDRYTGTEIPSDPFDSFLVP